MLTQTTMDPMRLMLTTTHLPPKTATGRTTIKLRPMATTTHPPTIQIRQPISRAILTAHQLPNRRPTMEMRRNSTEVHRPTVAPTHTKQPNHIRTATHLPIKEVWPKPSCADMRTL